MNFPFYIASRYLRSKSSQNIVNIINAVTFVVIVIGAMALFIVLSGFAGLKSFSLSFSNTFDPDLKALPSSGKVFTLTPEMENELRELPGIQTFSRELEERVYLVQGQKSHIAYIKGVDSLYNSVSSVDSTLYFGEWVVDGRRGVAGIGIANTLGLVPNNYQEPLVVLAPKPGKGSLSQVGFGQEKPYNELRLVVSGVYAVEENLDKKYLFTGLPLVQALLERKPDQVSGINVKVRPGTPIESLRESLGLVLGEGIAVRSRQELNSTLHRMLNTENVATYLIFTLVLIIALFNVVGAIIMMILDKQQDLKGLHSMGATVKNLRQIFFVQGVLVTTIGGFVGVVLGSLLIWSQLAFGWLKITPSLPYPVAYELGNVLLVLATITVLGILAAKVASSRIGHKLVAP